MLNFGQPAPIDIRVSGPNSDEAYAVASQLVHDLSRVPGIVDAMYSRFPTRPRSRFNVDRTLAREVGLGQRALGGQSSGFAELERAGGAEFLGRSAQ